MSGAVVVTPSTGAAWATAWEQFEGIRKGMISLSLTNYDATTVPQIASGSWIEAAGSIYKWTSNDTITGSPSANVINYVTLVPSGAGASAILTPTWASGAPTWSDAYQGWFSGTTRYAGGCYYDGTNYPLKWVYTNRHAGPRTGYAQIDFAQIRNINDVTITTPGIKATFDGGTDGYVAPIRFPQRAIVTAMNVQTDADASDDIQVTLNKVEYTAFGYTVMASVNATAGTPNPTDSSITEPVIDYSGYYYNIYMDNIAATIVAVEGVRVTYIEIVRC